MTSDFLTSTFAQLISADMYIIIAAVYGVCFALKQAKFFNDRFIPLAALATGILFQVLNAAVQGISIPNAIIKGVICGMAAVYTANIVKQIGSGNE